MTITEICNIVATVAIVVLTTFGVHSVLTGDRRSRIEHQFRMQSMKEIHAERHGSLTQLRRPPADINTGCPVCGNNGCPDCGEPDRLHPPFGYNPN
jgi:hypothetical protein